MVHIKRKNVETTECNKTVGNLLTIAPDGEDVVFTNVNLCKKCEKQFEKENGIIIKESE